VWALGSAGAIKHFPVLIGIEGLTILGETDDGGANFDAAEVCGNRWATAGIEVLHVEPQFAGDMKDVLRRIAP
jgi:hypothetical protein